MPCACRSSCRSRARISRRSGPRGIPIACSCGATCRARPAIGSRVRAGSNVSISTPRRSRMRYWRCSRDRTRAERRRARARSIPARPPSASRRRGSRRRGSVLERPQSGSRPALREVGKPTLEEAIAAFWRHHSRRRSPLRSSVARLAELALAPEPEVAAESTRVVFERIIEPLCDGFTRRGAETYRRMFAQIIMAARKRPECRALDDALAEAGVVSERDLLRVPNPRPLTDAERGRVRKVVVLSRMTLGADIAIAMPILKRAEALFPNARIAFVGSDAAKVLTRSFERVDPVEVPYGRSDLLAARLNAWQALMTAVR